ncbi:NAD(P)/FAD-dependent oxidoreductase [Streptomyces sp. DSM 44917]|uniref:NAD(P)/FAD-dependent oxidoreductase n=1 Tax=Streptomyces boetiae TaxID=3075541 RepID=A0ABU2L4M7_9ACTN|nr:NAD(P)/FAD-dependent oxidoreductase [Streptomyces sp. DSM 44917]MDT0306188.1 NAD(P)/FAD-dependent oxidoreductase [Streptomyces sp. DSM 44917]
MSTAEQAAASEHAGDGAAPTEHVDVLIIGAGLSGIGAACHLRRSFPRKSVAILESREAMGGTWDLFRYPGIRSDSDMFTLGYRFRPWTDSRAIADGPSILNYIRETAAEYGVDRAVRYRHRVNDAAWSGEDSRWTVTAERGDTGETVRLTCDFLFVCSGYYRYDEGYSPAFPGSERFTGPIVHPQHWPEDLDYAGKRVVVIGSGATAITLVPSMAGVAGHVTMLQRSPTYVLAMPQRDPVAQGLGRVLPGTAATYAVTRWKNVVSHTAFYKISRSRPKLVKSLLRKQARRLLPEGYDVDTHFGPRYDPWDQRVCVAPGGDLFRALRRGQVSVVTDTIETFTENGILLTSGEELPADVIVTATGLNLLAFGGIRLTVDGREVSLPETMAYKGMMLSDVPNFAFTVGYTNASWTLKADLVSEYVCRLLAHMDRHGYRQCVPERDASVREEPFLDFAAGYVLRAVQAFPKQGSRAPWRLRMNYLRDVVTLRHGPVDNAMSFRRGVHASAGSRSRATRERRTPAAR